jgi:hypothetical protein
MAHLKPYGGTPVVEHCFKQSTRCSCLHVGAEKNTPACRKRRLKGKPSAWGVYLSHPITGRHKFEDLVLQVGGWVWG